jgi:serine/threonine-protein kinase
MSYQIGDRIGDYQVVDVLGAGGMGKVYKVRNIISERIEALKVLLPNLESDPELADRFMREIKVQASLQHPNIAALHTAQRVNNQLLMIMEFVEGSSLEGELRKGPIPLGKGIDYISQALTALGYAHERGIVHRDIKPANMMVTPAGVVKLMDFGIAKIAADRRLTQTGRTMGSLYYMSPEQIQGATDLDGRADIYSLGVSLYEMVTRTRPFQGDSDYSIMAAHLGAHPVPPIQLDPTLPAVLNDVILMAIAKDPNQRFQKAEAFKTALQNVRSSIGRAPVAADAPRTATAMGGAVTPGVIAGAAPVPEPVLRQGSGRRGLYMAIGSVITVGILAVAAVQGPRLFKSSSAQTTDVPPPAVSAPATSSSPATSQVPEVQRPVQQPVPDEQQRQVLPSQARRPNTQTATPQGEAQTRPVETPAPSPVAAAQSAPGATPAQQPALPAAPAQQPPGADAAKQTALRDLRKDLMLLGTRANAIKGSLATMKREQSRQGLNLRGDIVSSEQQMEVFLDDAEAALRSGDADRVKENLEAAERQVEKLEKFLGR